MLHTCAMGSSGAGAEDLEWLAAEEVHLTERATAAGGKPMKKVNLVSYGQLQLTYVATDDAVASLADLPGQELITEAETLRSDLLPAKYEGGLKIWECTHDLANFLASQPDVSLSGRKVLDLGCGAGLLGLLAVSQGASEVHFQDYVRDELECYSTLLEHCPYSGRSLIKLCWIVLLEGMGPDPAHRSPGYLIGEPKASVVLFDLRSLYMCRKMQNVSVLASVTSQNVLLNAKENAATRLRFFAGDWQSYLLLTDEEFKEEESKFDCILSSETIYNPSNHAKLYSVFKKRLKINGTVVSGVTGPLPKISFSFLAAKTYYFGVGGGLRQFEQLLEEDGVMESSVCWKCSEGVQREILKITFKTK